MRGNKFALDRANGKILGVCAGLAEATGWDVTLIRVALVVVTLAGLFPWTLIAYAAAYFVAKPVKIRGLESRPGKAAASISAASLKASMTEVDRRLAEIETYVTSPNHQLAREIDALR
jgi:phage shock protein C